MLNDNIKNIVFDIGGVLADPCTGHWFISENFYNIFPELESREDDLKKALKNNINLQDMRNVYSEDEEALMFRIFYKKVLEDLNYHVTEEKLDLIVKDVVYNDQKFLFYSDVEPTLNNLSNYRLGILSDGWISSYRVLKNNGLDKYFDKILVSSVYGSIKKDGTFFEALIKEMNIDPKETIFIDDREKNLEVAERYGFIPVRMDRKITTKPSKYKVINSLDQLIALEK